MTSNPIYGKIKNGNQTTNQYWMKDLKPAPSFCAPTELPPKFLHPLDLSKAPPQTQQARPIPFLGQQQVTQYHGL